MSWIIWYWWELISWSLAWEVRLLTNIVTPVAPWMRDINYSSDVNKDLGFKVKAKAKDLGFKAKTKAKDLSFKAKAKDLSFKAKAKAKDLTQVLESRPRTWGSVLKDRQGPRPRTHHRVENFQAVSGSFQESFQKLEKFPLQSFRNVTWKIWKNQKESN